MNIIFTMCFTGSVLFLLYFFAIKFFNNFISNCWKYTVLKFVLLLYLIPLGFLKLIQTKLVVPSGFELSGKAPLKVITPQNSYANFTYQVQNALVIIWITMAITVFIWQFLKYYRLKKMIQHSLIEVTDLDILSFTIQYQQSLKIKRKVRLFHSNYISPFTTGIFSPIIILPADLPPEKQKLILKHELIHIQRYDTLFLYLRHLIKCFYWFNPLVYLLETQVEKVIEASCDETVTFDMDQRERMDYASLILDMAAYNIQYRRTYASLLNNQAINLKERIDQIMIPKTRKKYKKEASIILAACMVICSSITALAYQPPTEIQMISYLSSNPLADINSSDSIAFQSGSFYSQKNHDTILYDDQFTDIFGNIYKINGTDQSAYAVCDHNYIDGTISKHSKKSDGSCVTSCYDGQRCSKCTYITSDSLIKTETYSICPH